MKTAIEILEIDIEKCNLIPSDKTEVLISKSDLRKLLFVAKQMEKKQIISAVEWNYKSNCGEVYFNATYRDSK